MHSQPPQALYCSFCRRSQSQVQQLIARKGIYICNECVHQFRNLLKQGSNKQESVCEDCSQDTPKY